MSTNKNNPANPNGKKPESQIDLVALAAQKDYDVDIRIGSPKGKVQKILQLGITVVGSLILLAFSAMAIAIVLDGNRQIDEKKFAYKVVETIIPFVFGFFAGKIQSSEK
jgi:hypothetical protein